MAIGTYLAGIVIIVVICLVDIRNLRADPLPLILYVIVADRVLIFLCFCAQFPDEVISAANFG